MDVVTLLETTGVFGLIIGLFYRVVDKKIDDAKAERDRKYQEEKAEREARQEKVDAENKAFKEFLSLIFDKAMATGDLTEAMAVAIQRNPANQCNGDMTSALAAYRKNKKKNEHVITEKFKTDSIGG